MKARRIIYLILAIFLIVLNVLVDILNYKDLYLSSSDPAYIFGSIIGGHIFMIVGLIFLKAAFKLKRKINTIKNNALLTDIDSIGRAAE